MANECKDGAYEHKQYFLSLLAFAPAICRTRQESQSLVNYAQSTKKGAFGGVNYLSWEDLQ